MNRHLAPSFLLAALLASLGCDRAADVAAPVAAPGANVVTLPTIDVALAGRQFKLEVADEPDERATGLMHRRSMPVDHGMLFAFPDVAHRSFWMKNTLIPLDIAYLDAGGVVLNVAPMVPRDLTDVPSDGPAKYAIEVNAGIAQRIGLEAGDRVALPAIDAK